jgi:hypothetical protein
METKIKICIVDGCTKPIKKNSGKGLCAMHTNRFYRHGDVNFSKHVKSGGKCVLLDCNSDAFAGGYCSAHYHKIQRYGNPDISLNENQKDKICLVENCEKDAFSKGYCQTHYKTVFKYGREFTIIGEKGLGTITKDGYREFNINGERILEHVMIAEKALGRKLIKGEVIHHIDEDKLNNDPSNLFLCPSQAYHMFVHTQSNIKSNLPTSENPNVTQLPTLDIIEF